MHAGDNPSQFDLLSPEQQAALLGFIRYAFDSATRRESRNSYDLKQDFERVGFYISNGAFKGAMLAAGFEPTDPAAQNWHFRVRPQYRNRKLRDPRWDDERGRYLLKHLSEQDRAEFDALVARAKATDPAYQRSRAM